MSSSSAKGTVAASGFLVSNPPPPLISELVTVLELLLYCTVHITQMHD